MNNRNLLYLNLAVDENDISLGFADSWIKQFSNNFDHVDVITLNKSVKNISKYENINIYGISKEANLSKLNKLLKIKNIISELTSRTNYDLCFSHMSPLLLVLISIFANTKKLHKILWYTHPKPNNLFKKIILYASAFYSIQIVTASKSSFPFKLKKVNNIGHAIDYDLFLNKRDKIINNDFVILSRISKSKNLEIAIDGFLKSKFNKNSISIIGDAVTKKDEQFKIFLQNKYNNNKNVIFKGRVPHKELPLILNNYSYHINATPQGFYDKSVLETLSSGLYNFYSNIDYNKHFDNNLIRYTNFKLNSLSLAEILNSVHDLEEKTILEIIKVGQKNVANESVSTIYKRIISIAENLPNQ